MSHKIWIAAFVLVVLGIAFFSGAFSNLFSAVGYPIPYCNPPKDVSNPTGVMAISDLGLASKSPPGFILFTDNYQGICNRATDCSDLFCRAWNCEFVKPVGSSISGSGTNYQFCATEAIPPSCTPSISVCSDWSLCSASQQTRTCDDGCSQLIESRACQFEDGQLITEPPPPAQEQDNSTIIFLATVFIIVILGTVYWKIK